MIFKVASVAWSLMESLKTKISSQAGAVGAFSQTKSSSTTTHWSSWVKMQRKFCERRSSLHGRHLWMNSMLCQRLQKSYIFWQKNDTRVFKKVANNALSTDSFNGFILLWLFSLFRALKKHNNYFIKVPCHISTECYLISASKQKSRNL